MKERKSVRLNRPEDDDREQFILDNQEPSLYGATQEFGMRDDHFEKDGKLPEGMFRFEKRMP